MIRSIARAAIAAALVIPIHAHAHVTLEVQEASADSWHKLRLGVPHGCAGSPTTAVRLRLPDGILSARPQPKPGWMLEIVRSKLDGPVTDSHGNPVTERGSEIRWTGGRLPDDNFEEFLVQVRLPDRPGETLYFPTVQDCETGVHRWIDIPEAGKTRGDYRQPAPHLRLLPTAHRPH